MQVQRNQRVSRSTGQHLHCTCFSMIAFLFHRYLILRAVDGRLKIVVEFRIVFRFSIHQIIVKGADSQLLENLFAWLQDKTDSKLFSIRNGYEIGYCKCIHMCCDPCHMDASIFCVNCNYPDAISNDIAFTWTQLCEVHKYRRIWMGCIGLGS